MREFGFSRAEAASLVSIWGDFLILAAACAEHGLRSNYFQLLLGSNIDGREFTLALAARGTETPEQIIADSNLSRICGEFSVRHYSIDLRAMVEAIRADGESLGLGSRLAAPFAPPPDCAEIEPLLLHARVLRAAIERLAESGELAEPLSARRRDEILNEALISRDAAPGQGSEAIN